MSRYGVPRHVCSFDSETVEIKYQDIAVTAAHTHWGGRLKPDSVHVCKAVATLKASP